MKSPNYTQIPNAFLESMHEFTGEQVMVFMAICRKTIGWHKLSGKVSYGQIMEMTGIKHRQTINRAIAALKEKDWITVSGDSKRGYFYDLNIETSSRDERARSPDELEEGHGMNEPKQLNKSTVKTYPTPKEKKENIKKESTPAPVDAIRASPDLPLKRNEEVGQGLFRLTTILRKGDTAELEKMVHEAEEKNKVTAEVA